ncbi:sensor histidine kinase [Microcella alkalica]|uniref:Sensor-like histidine kinase SenX3 n=1 Tax=Microcella alkalica TaxID=355930 RepID=A0A839E852_9MICO|nr:HAMP domain-containing sensor histidine kinase [Microcella alkalica]MBA8848701.1 signal transduction histidine kinase [Microcella alkalica]
MSTAVDPPTTMRPLLSPRFTGRLLQTTFFLLFLIATLLLLAISPEVVMSAPYGVGFALIVLSTIVPYLPVFDDTAYRPWMLAMPIADFLAFVSLRLEATGGVTNPMIMMLMIPAAWFGLAASRRTLLLMVPAVLAVVTPDIALIIAGGLTDTMAERTIVVIVVFPAVAFFAAAAALAMAELIGSRQASLIEEQHRRSEAAHETERARTLLSEVLDSLDAGIVVMSPTGDLLLMNRALRDSPVLTSRGRDPWETFQSVPTFGMDRVTEISVEDRMLNRVSRGEYTTDQLIWIGDPGTRQRAISVSSCAVRTKADEHIANVILVSDVTDLIEAIDAKDAFIGTVSHELRTPLTTLAGFLEIIMERSDQFDPEVVSWLGVMERNIRRQQLLVHDLLLAASTRSTSLSVSRSRTDLGMIARDVVAALRPEAEEKGVSLDVVGGPVEGRFDPLRMAQVAENLVTNAVRYTPAGGSVSVSVSGDADHLHLVVSDTGVGIAPEDQERLFEQFFRAAQARASAIRGIGLGLAIVKAIVDAHGGEVALESEPGRGTTVTVCIPHSA